MKKIVSITLCISIIMSILSLLTGCTSTNQSEAVCTSFVLGVHANFPTINYNTTSFYSKIYDSAYSWGSVSAIVVDGDPSLQCNCEIKSPEKRINEAKHKQLAKDNTNTIISKIMNIKAVVPEIDTLQAIIMSADALNSTLNEYKKNMIIFDSGLSTSGLLNFSQQSIIDVPVETIVEQLEEKHAIPNLSGIDVTWIGLGQVCGEQDNLTTTYEYKLRTLWKAILNAGNASSIDFDDSPIPNEVNSEELPECSLVPIVADRLDVSNTAAEVLPDIIKYDETTSVKFKSNKAEFVNTNMAESDLLPIAKYLVAYPSEVIYIVGMIATVGDEGSGKMLSLQRAEACRDILIRNGADESQLHCIGLGYSPNSLRVNDLDDKGNLVEAMAQKNRAVFFIDSRSPLVDTIIKPNS